MLEINTNELMGEKEFFDELKQVNHKLIMHERWLLVAISKSFTHRKETEVEK